MFGSGFTRAGTGALLVLACGFASGCGGDGTFHVSGTVTFNGQPVPEGKIYFMPDGSKGNTGPSGYADIKDGRYDTSSGTGRGAVAGPVVISIDAVDTAAKSDKSDKAGDVLFKPLFPRYEIQAELPKSSSTKDIDVPASAAAPKSKKGAANP